MSDRAEEVYRAIREYRAYLATGTRVRRRDIAALRFTGAPALEELKFLRQQLEDAALHALRELSLKPADLFELLFLARERDYKLGLRCDRDVEGGVECVRADALDELDGALDRLALDNVETAAKAPQACSEATSVRHELVRRANELLDDLLCSCSPPSQSELWQYWLDVKGIDQLIACLKDLDLSAWAVKLAQETRLAAKATDEFHASTWRKIGGWEAPDHDFLVAQERGCRIEMAYVLCEIRQKLPCIGAEQSGSAGKGTSKQKHPRPRSMAKVLTKQQEAVVAAIEDYKLPVAKIAEQRGCSDKAVYAIYERAKRNPGYKTRRSINLGRAKPLHANTRGTFDRADE